MGNEQKAEDWRDVAERLFKKSGFGVFWVAFLAVVLTFVSWPIRNAFLVCWIYGRSAYFQEGIHVLKGKPLRFSNGELVPTSLDLATGFETFFITAFGLTMLLIFFVRFCERHIRNSKGHS